MIGIYNDSFIEYLKENLKCDPKITSTNIITRCPICWDHHSRSGKDHRHLYIGLEAPIFHCFQSGCQFKGTIPKLVKEIEGYDNSEKFINKDKIKEYKKVEIKKSREKSRKSKLVFPEINPENWRSKEFYLRKRLKFSNMNINNMDGLIFNVNEFINVNNILIDFKLAKIKDFLHNNFIGFATRNRKNVIFRNINERSSFRYYKLKIFDSKFMDYYCLGANNNILSNTIILAEGIFDIFCEYIFDSTENRQQTKIYASAQSDKFQTLLKSIIIDEQIFRPDVKILSDKGLPLKYYEKFKKYNNHIINTLTIYYNKIGKDFGDGPLPTKFVL